MCISSQQNKMAKMIRCFESCWTLKLLIVTCFCLVSLEAFTNLASITYKQRGNRYMCSNEFRFRTRAAKHLTIKCSDDTISGYSASDAGDRRKNPSLYQQEVAVAAAGMFTTDSRPISKPEILAPAGGWPQLRAAVQNGADAVYFGLSEFNARARASNFDPDDELPEVMAYLHTHGVLGYAVLNVLVFDTELDALEAMVRKIAKAGVDAVIVQDLVRPPPPRPVTSFSTTYPPGLVPPVCVPPPPCFGPKRGGASGPSPPQSHVEAPRPRLRRRTAAMRRDFGPERAGSRRDGGAGSCDGGDDAGHGGGAATL